MRTQGWVTPAVAVVAVLSLAACGSGSSAARKDPATSKQSTFVTELPASFRSQGLLATSNHVIRFDQLHPGDADHLVAIDLRTGTEKVLPPPDVRAGHVHVTLGRVALADDLLDVGQTCEALALDGDEMDQVCDPDVSIHRIDPSTGRWSPTELDPSLAALDIHSVAMLQALPDGRAVADLMVDGNSRAVAAVLDGDRWTQVGDPVERGSTVKGCATTTQLVRLLAGPAPTGTPNPGGVQTVAFHTEVRSLADGSISELPGPGVDGTFGGVGVGLACGATQVVATSKASPNTFVFHGAGWEAAGPAPSNTTSLYPAETWSGGPAPLTAWSPIPYRNSGTPKPITLTSIDSSGKAVRIEPASKLVGVEILALGPTGTFLLVGPSETQTERKEKPKRGQPLPIRLITVS